jgi:hypothetical protein
MNSKSLELALKKQRVMLESARLRGEFLGHLTAISPVFYATDHLYRGAVWLRQHPQVPIGLAMALIIAKPKRVITWTRRLIFGWQVWRKLNNNLKANALTKILR